MGVFTQKDEIERLARELASKIQRRYYDVVEDSAKEIAEELIEEKGLDDICRDIDEAISYADEMIHYEADRLALPTYDSYLLATFAPYPENQEVDETIVGEVVCGEEFDIDRAVSVYAYELWRVGIEKSLRRILKEKCSKAGKLRSVLAKVKG